MRGAGQRQFLRRKPIAVGRTALDQRQRLQRLDRRARIDRPLDVAERQHAACRRHRPPRSRRDGGFRPARRAAPRPGPDYSLFMRATCALPRFRREPFILALSWKLPAPPLPPLHAARPSCCRFSPCSCCRSRPPPRSMPMRAARPTGATPTGPRPAACRRQRREPEARVLVMSGRTGGWKGVFAVHTWIVLKRENATKLAPL